MFYVSGYQEILGRKYTFQVVEILGDQGRHSRLAMGTSELLQGSPVEVEMIVEVQELYNS